MYDEIDNLDNRTPFSDKYGTEDNSSGKCRIEETSSK
jgi:hypothetical protein